MVIAALLMPSLLQAEETPPAATPGEPVQAESSSGPTIVEVPDKNVANLFKNGDFQSGKTGWRGRGKVVDIGEGKKALEIDFNDRTPSIVSTTVRPDHDTRVLHIFFKARSDRNPSSEEKANYTMEVRILNPKENIYYYWRLPVKESKEFQQFSLTYRVSKFATELNIEIEPKMGNGIAYLAEVVGQEIGK